MERSARRTYQASLLAAGLLPIVALFAPLFEQGGRPLTAMELLGRLLGVAEPEHGAATLWLLGMPIVMLATGVVHLARYARRSVATGAGVMVTGVVLLVWGWLETWDGGSLGVGFWVWFGATLLPLLAFVAGRGELRPLAGSAGWYTFRDRWLVTRARRLTLVVCVAAFLAGGVGTQAYRVDAKLASFRSGALEGPEVFYLPPHTALRLMSLGHESFLADLLWVRFYAYFLRHLYSDRIFEWFDPYVDAIRFLDPDNPRIYLWASQRVKYAQLITKAVIEKSNEYARLGISQFPNDWRFYNDIGFNLFFEYRYADEEEKRRLQDEAREYFTMAANLPNSQLDPNFVTELYMRNNDTRMALFQAYRAYHEASPMERKYLLRRIEQLESPAAARELAQEEERWRARYPFLPFGVFQLIGGGTALSLPTGWRSGVGAGAAHPD